jgi:diguanylate cyclase (GGDEF)-like protein
MFGHAFRWSYLPRGRPMRVRLARVLSLVTGLIVVAATLLLLMQLSTVTDSTRAATDLAELRTRAQRVALAAELAGQEADSETLEVALASAEDVLARLPDHLYPAIGEERAGLRLASVHASWDRLAGLARAYLEGDTDLGQVIAAADATGVAVGGLMAVVTDHSEASAARLRSVLLVEASLLAVGMVLFAASLVVGRRRSTDVDPLTGVLTRDRFRGQVDVALLNRRGWATLAIAVIDIDRFRRINQTLGAEQGDRVLRDVARRIQDVLPRDATLGRRSGDEFLLLLPGRDPQAVREVVAAILGVLDQPLVYQTGELRAGVSIGIALAPRDGTAYPALLHAADQARDAAKAEGGGTYRFADGGAAEARHDDTLQLEIELRRALEQGEFELYYQPQVSVRSGEIVGAEALLRWRSPTRGLVSPERFVPLLEESRLIVPVGQWVIQTAARQARAWVDLCDRPFRIAVNVSARQLFQSDLVTTVRRAIADSGLQPENLDLEVTETVAIRHTDEAVRVLDEIAALGVRSSLDDFGTGHSWLGHLRLLPHMSLKVDRSFIAGLTRNEEDRAIVAGLITVAHTLRRTVIAEGVERAAELTMLEDMGCDVAQGYFFSRPLPAHQFEALLQRERPWMPAHPAPDSPAEPDADAGARAA